MKHQEKHMADKRAEGGYKDLRDRMQVHLKAMETGTQEVAASVVRHCTARLTHDENWAIIEVAHEPTVHAQAARIYI